MPAPALSRRFSIHPAPSETCRVPTEQMWAKRWWPGSDWAAPIQADLFKSNNSCKTFRSSSQNTTAAPNPVSATTRQVAVLCSQQPLSWGSPPPFHISAVKRLRPGNISTPPSSKPNPNGIQMSSMARMKQVFIESASSTPYFIDTEMLRIPNLIALKSMMNAKIKFAGVLCTR